MKKIFFALIALVGAMSMNAQEIKVMKGNVVVATFIAEEADNVVFTGVPTRGSAAIKGGGTVNWVQLWADGPKFAEMNVGASSATDKGTMMTFADVTKTGDDYVWGVNWCTPSKDDFEELVKATSADDDVRNNAKVTCSYVKKNAVWGFEFTGKETDYTINSIFFPIVNGNNYWGYADFWSCTPAEDNKGYNMSLNYSFGAWASGLYSSNQDDENSVRPVLKEN